MKRRLTIACLALSAGLMGCASRGDESRAVARLSPTQGNNVQGTLAIQGRGDLRLVGEVRGLTPNAEHGFHVHERGDCSSPDASSAGGHFNPAGSPHGHPDTATRHAGDLPNLKADAQGVARVSVPLTGLTLGPGPNGILQRSIVVHRDADDYRTQPSGNSGARLACAVIQAA